MQTSARKPLDYLTIGHVTQDLTSSGFTLGGTASYAPLTAAAFGMRAAILTACGGEMNLNALGDLEVMRKPSTATTTFENIESASGRRQYLHQTAEALGAADIPKDLPPPRILHIGPVADEVDEGLAAFFPEAFIGLTPQGWMRSRGMDGLVEYKKWSPMPFTIERADAVVISVEDVRGDEDLIAEYARLFRILAVTEGVEGARVYWHGDVRRMRAPKVNEVDRTGAGDIFAAAFFIRLEATRDAWEAAACAVAIASLSVTRAGLAGVPSPEEVKSNLVEIMRGS